ncbi:30S ribosomal protein S5 [Erythrobacter litoralis]|uniref:Small ribosomal subunit protein uS5 n=1 Tax=Erythrobacter litoralis (strain HTCC2594) TaxID=314225 RepID=RS5_ERYLH|nr:30S ribosomal protein S5 [Erythrobacter litoralis]Q2N9C8.1 RecName: Full=Small ribosomal subunit protein uS5; AltName: Full=30S ribosomal protein S5 [Erythrobacter litoralis HTCC2594]ABC63713.1 ribosomal protein S5 [Erythrobacter litoralis HTCC2594]
MMADEKKTPENEAETATPAVAVEDALKAEPTETLEAQKAKAEAETPAVAETPSEAAANQSAAQGAEGQPRERGGHDRGGRGGRGGNDRGRGRGGRDNRRGGRREEEDDGIIEKLVHINRVSKTVKGGKRFGFAALVVVGDGQGRVGFGKGKAREVPEAIQKATAAARKKMIRVALKEGRTLHHDGNGRFGAGKVTVRTAPPGTGIIAGGPMRAVFESLGVADVVTKSVGTSNPYNMIRATFDALQDQTSPKSVAQRRGKKVADLLGRGGASEAEAEADAAAIAE